MRLRCVCALAVALAAAVLSASGADVSGRVIVKRKLTHWNVTAAAPAYGRGVTVPLEADRGVDPLAFERTHVAIYLEKRGGSLPEPQQPVDIAQQGRRFVPDMVVIPAGGVVSFPNLDPIFHNVFSLSKAKSFDLGNYSRNHSRTVVFPKPGIVFVNCHLHPNMAAVIVVAPGAWFTRPDAAGEFSLRGVPPGEYTIVAWHKTAGFFRQKISVPLPATAHVEFFLPLGEEAARN